MLVQPLSDPIPRSIWKLIAQDHFVDFEKLFASMERGYDHNDEPREFAGGFSLIKKDASSAKRALQSESDWIRVFDAWKTGVILVYKHRASELEFYKRFVLDLFRGAPFDPKVAISFDLEARDRYAKSPFRMDDRNELNIPLFTQIFRGPSANPSSLEP